ncbi:MAG: S1 RNA-binding domain-containing protein, partial [Gammaproteobacteria bacterium]|nr:S1 RNA-binding domain-containing protein [Gammaproteobacteria bacterium]
KDPHAVVKTGEVVKVKVVEVDPQRKRIALSMRLTESVKDRQIPERNSKPAQTQRNIRQQKQAQPEANNAFALAFANAKK